MHTMATHLHEIAISNELLHFSIYFNFGYLPKSKGIKYECGYVCVRVFESLCKIDVCKQIGTRHISMLCMCVCSFRRDDEGGCE